MISTAANFYGSLSYDLESKSLTSHPGNLVRIRTLMTQYATLPMDFADASLVVAAERLNLRGVFTLDRRDFLLYRPRNVAAFDVFP